MSLTVSTKRVNDWQLEFRQGNPDLNPLYSKWNRWLLRTLPLGHKRQSIQALGRWEFRSPVQGYSLGTLIAVAYGRIQTRIYLHGVAHTDEDVEDSLRIVLRMIPEEVRAELALAALQRVEDGR